jgi:hypothetical protein
MKTRVCTACHERKALSEFRKSGKRSAPGDRCIECEEKESGRGASTPPSAAEEMIKLPPD